MRIFNINKGVRGSRTIQEHALRFAYMIQETAKRRARALTFWHNHGTNATIDAFSVSRATLYRWLSALNKEKGKLEALNNKSKTPKKRNKRRTDYRIAEYIIEMRKEHPRIGKKKLTPLLRIHCIKWNIHAPSEPTVGRIIKDLKDRDRLPQHHRLSLNARSGKLHILKRKKRKKLRRKGHKATKPGELVELDTVVLFINNIKRYIITAIDVHGRFAYAKVYKTPSSANAKDFFKELERVVPFTISHIQTDNGSEFEKHFRKYVEGLGIVHFNTYPRCPKMNAHIERFNRTIQEEFANHHLQTLYADMDVFQGKLIDWLTWYNTERPHEALGLVSPLWYITGKLVTESQSG